MAQAAASNPGFDSARRQLFVVGNEAADADSLVSAFVLAALLDSPETQAVPLTQIPREEFRLRGDALALFKLAGCELAADGSPSALRFWNEVDWDVVRGLDSRGLVLVDHNKMTPKVKDNFDSKHVEWILDHHANSQSYPEARCDLDESLGSACTLVAEQFAKASREVTSPLGVLLAGVIILDCRNFDTKENKGTPRDRAALESLTKFLPEVGQDAWFNQLTEARKDVSHLSVRELLLLDMKAAPVGGFPGSVAFCAIFSTLDELLAKAGGPTELIAILQGYARDKGYEGVVANTATDAGGLKGLLVVPASDQEALVEAICGRVAGAPGNLPPELRENKLYEAQGILSEGFGLQPRLEDAPLKAFRMRSEISRKTLLPRIVTEAGAS